MVEQMIAAQKETTEAIKALADALANTRERIVENEIFEPKTVSSGQDEVSSGQDEAPKIVTVYTRERIVENGKEYTRQTHPLLFAVVDWLEDNKASRVLSVRKLASAFTDATNQKVSKSWAAVAKNYWQNQTDE